MTKELRRLSILMLMMFLALFASTTWIQGIQSADLADYPCNTRFERIKFSKVNVDR